MACFAFASVEQAIPATRSRSAPSRGRRSADASVLPLARGPKVSSPLALIAVLVSVPLVSASATSDPSVLNGVYRISWTERELMDAGARRIMAHSNYGVTIMTLRDGRFLWHAASHPPDSRNGHYRVSGRRLFLDFRGTGCTGYVDAPWTLADGRLRLHVTGSDPP